MSNELEVYFLNHITVLSKKIDIINMTYSCHVTLAMICTERERA